MIHIQIKKENQEITSIEISGHSGYAKSGYDIVCSAVSSIVITSVNAILSLEEETIAVTDDGSVLKIRIKKHDRITDILIENMLNLLKELENQYQKNIKMEGE